MNAHTGTTGGTSERELKSPTVSSVSGSAEAGSDEAGSDEVWIRVRCEETTRHLPGAVKRKKYKSTTRTEEETRSQTNTRTNQVTGWESVWHAAAAGSGSGSADHLDALVAVFLNHFGLYDHFCIQCNPVMIRLMSHLTNRILILYQLSTIWADSVSNDINKSPNM